MKISPEVRAVLERNITVNGGEVKIGSQLDRLLYMKLMKTLTALGATWNRKLAIHISDEGIGSRIEQALVKGEVTTDQDVGFFPTPRALAERMAEFVVPVPGISVLEPSAGTGILADAAAERGAIVTCVEYFGMRADALSRRFAILAIDFMEYARADKFGGIISNPPFCKVGRGDCLDHFRLMTTLLAPGGRLACVMPASLLFREDARYAETRKLIGRMGGRIEALPPATFKESGTLVNTCLVTIG